MLVTVNIEQPVTLRPFIGNWQLAPVHWQLATGNWQLATRGGHADGR